MDCNSLIACLSQLPFSNIDSAGIVINTILMVANVCVLIVMIKTYRKQSKQIEESKEEFNKQFDENKRQFSDRSFQDAFFGLFGFLNEEKEYFAYSKDRELEDKELKSLKVRSLYMQIRDFVREDFGRNTASVIEKIKQYQPSVKDPMPLVKNILLLIHKNLDDNSIDLDSAMFYAGLVASKLNIFAIREYRLFCVREYIRTRLRKDYDIAIELNVFGILDEPYQLPDIDDVDKIILEHITNIIEGHTPF